MDSHVKSITDTLRASIVDRHITADNLLGIVISAVELAEEVATTGSNKKLIVISALDTIITETVAEAPLAAFIKKLVPPTIDAACALASGLYNINKKRKSWCCC